ncbi:hypothetical protein UFOVP84_79 [uncultured Caudovirales phage]|uniref:Uncharacterized protein n=1 Tax=uncultured Caudovirales phage TaxID=2100421 RepID=A0A6J5KYU7_9CAUD|nr:hypothetical protein UFOVP84_79 [uncultured Caudovirales phage]
MKELYDYLKAQGYGVVWEDKKLLFHITNADIFNLVKGLNFAGNYEIVLVKIGKYEIRECQ